MRDVLFEADFWWLVGYLQGDGTVDRRNGLWFHSTDIELIRHSQSMVSKLFGLNSRVYVEKRLQPWKPKFRMAVYSRKLVAWLESQKLVFGRRRWNVPSLPLELFSPYLGGLFDAEGNVFIRRNKIKTDKILHIVIHSTNQQSLSIISEKLSQYGARTILLSRRRTNRPGVYCELRFCEKTNLQWFVNNIGRFSCLTRKNRFLTPEYVPGRAASGTGPGRIRTFDLRRVRATS